MASGMRFVRDVFELMLLMFRQRLKNWSQARGSNNNFLNLLSKGILDFQVKTLHNSQDVVGFTNKIMGFTNNSLNHRKTQQRANAADSFRFQATHSSQRYVPTFAASNRAWYTIQASASITCNRRRPATSTTSTHTITSSRPPRWFHVSPCGEDMEIINTSVTRIFNSQQLACEVEGWGKCISMIYVLCYVNILIQRVVSSGERKVLLYKRSVNIQYCKLSNNKNIT